VLCVDRRPSGNRRPRSALRCERKDRSCARTVDPPRCAGRDDFCELLSRSRPRARALEANRGDGPGGGRRDLRRQLHGIRQQGNRPADRRLPVPHQREGRADHLDRPIGIGLRRPCLQQSADEIQPLRVERGRDRDALERLPRVGAPARIDWRRRPVHRIDPRPRGLRGRTRGGRSTRDPRGRPQGRPHAGRRRDGSHPHRRARRRRRRLPRTLRSLRGGARRHARRTRRHTVASFAPGAARCRGAREHPRLGWRMRTADRPGSGHRGGRH